MSNLDDCGKTKLLVCDDVETGFATNFRIQWDMENR